MKIVLLLLFSIFILCGCSTSESNELNLLVPFNEPSNETTEEVEKKILVDYGYEVNYIFSTEILNNEKLLIDLAANEEYSLVKTDITSFETVVNEGQALDLRPYLEEYGQNIIAAIPEEAWAMVTDESGAIYGIPSVEKTTISNNFIYYRKDIVDVVPTTLEAFQNSVCELSSTLMIPFALTNDQIVQIDHLRAAFGIPYDWNETNGEMRYIGYDDNFYAYLNYLNEIYQCGGLGEDFGYISEKLAMESFVNGDAAFMVSNPTEQVEVAEMMGESYNTNVGVLPPLNDLPFKDNSIIINYVSFVPVYMEETCIEIIKLLDQLVQLKTTDPAAYFYIPINDFYDDVVEIDEGDPNNNVYVVKSELLLYPTNSNYYVATADMNVYVSGAAIQLVIDDVVTKSDITSILNDEYQYQEVANEVNIWYGENQ